MEANTSQRKWWIPCCKNIECPDCKGRGKVYPERCPIHYYKGELKTLRFLYESYHYKNILPFHGSPIDQPKVLFEYFTQVTYYLGLIDDIKGLDKEENADIAADIMSHKKRT